MILRKSFKKGGWREKLPKEEAKNGRDCQNVTSRMTLEKPSKEDKIRKDKEERTGKIGALQI